MKLAFFRSVGQGTPLWSGNTRYHLAGQSPSVSTYDQPGWAEPDHLTDRIRGGVHTIHESLPLSAPTLNREARRSAEFTSLPAARTWQGYFQHNWSHMLGTRPVIQPRPLTQNFNPHQPGTKELHPATVYNPWPSMGALSPKVV